MNIWNKKIENDNRISKSNYWSRLGYSIEDIILEKGLIFDNSTITGK